MANKKESFFERLAKKNVEQKEKVTLKSKKARIATYSILGALAVSIGVGIGVPIIVSSTKINYIPKINDTEKVFEFKTPDKTINVPLSEIKKFLDDPIKKTEAQTQEAFFTEVIYKLYNEEYEDSLKYEYLINKTKNKGEEDTNNIHLSSLDEIRTTNKNTLLDYKNLYQKNFGLEKWETEFVKFLSNQYNGAKTIEEALETLVLKTITPDALRRFSLIKNDTFKKEDWDRRAPRDIKELEIVDGEVREKQDGKIIYKFNDYIFRDKLLIKVSDINSPKTNENTLIKYVNNDPNNRVEKIQVLLNDSFSLDPNKRSALNIINEYSKQRDILQITQAKILGIANLDNSFENWTINKQELINLFSHSAIRGLQKNYKMLEKEENGLFKPDNEGCLVFEHLNIDLFLQFFNNVNLITPSDEEKILNKTLKAYLPKFITKLDGNLGTKDVQNINEVSSSLSNEELLTLLNGDLKIANETIEYNGSILSKIFEKLKVKINELFKKNTEEVRNYQNIKQKYDSEKTKPANERTITVNKLVEAYNKALESVINSLSDEEMKKEFGSIFREEFYGISNENVRMFYAYKKNDKVFYVVPTTDGISLISYKTISNTNDEIFKSIIFDMNKTLYGEELVNNYQEEIKKWKSSSQNIDRVFLLKYLKNEDFDDIKNKLIKDGKVSKELIEKHISKETLEKSLKNKIKEQNSNLNISTINKIKEHIEKISKNKERDDFIVSGDLSKIKLMGHDGNCVLEDSVNGIINLLIKKIFKGGE
ncbi:HinT-interacting membrane complex protein P80 [Mycoplasma elephantis]|uniref:HinT-interacting membrane complex protein P80 n=1 Tax=Mycoplasma elephantis TaxID=114882 RepID=UPI0004818162|nr:hypothetical protein [Mycoplasma elephantis]